MKKIYPLIILLFFVSAVQAQELPNSGFETWENVGTYEQPTPWNTPNPFTSIAGVVTVTKSTDAYAGEYSARLESILLSFGTFQFNVPGLVTYADFDVDFISQDAEISGGLYMPETVQNFSGKYKFTGAEGDSASVLIYSFAHPEGEDIDTIGLGATFLHDAEDWTEFSVPMYLLNDHTPDTFNVIIISSGSFNLEQVKPGSVLMLDELAIETGVGIFNLPEKTTEVSVFPNPTSNFLTFETAATNPDRQVTVYDVNGRKVKEFEYTQKSLTVDMSELPVGNYSYLMKANNELLNSGSFIKQ